MDECEERPMLNDALRISTTHRRRARSAFAFAISSTLLGATLLLTPASPAAAQARPANLADLVDAVAEAVVNISATQTVEDKDATPDLPKGTPFDEMFEEFFRNHGINPSPVRARRNLSVPASSSTPAASSLPTITSLGTPTTSSSFLPTGVNSRPMSSARTPRSTSPS